ncbi:MAG: hypothetical protein IH991_08275 [Planctomycetes bacterium]|nr:hypothetical protein [Planctomycetota bacterium]
MKTRKMSILIVGVFAVLASASSARADGPFRAYGGCYPWGFYGGNFANPNRRVIPYFAQHPPVYYSDIVPRPFGYSPYALPPGIAPVEVVKEAPKAQEVINPYFRPKKEKATLDKTAVAVPQVIENPFYVQREDRQPAAKLVDN